MAESLTEALEREHQEIDAGVEAFLDGLAVGETRTSELTRAVEALRRHIYLEEEFLFPPLRSAGMLPPVLVMLREHGDIWRALDALQDTDLESGTAQAREQCTSLLAQLAAHNAKEEPIIYPQGDALLSDDAKRALHAHIETGGLPDGWVCAQA